MMSQNELFSKVRKAVLSVKIRVWDKTFKLKLNKKNSDQNGPEFAQWEKFTPSVKIMFGSADEKLRSLGHHKNQQIKTADKTQPNNNVEERTVQQSTNKQDETPSQQTLETAPPTEEMAERKVYTRQGRKDQQGSSNVSTMEKLAIKHRSRSAGPAGRLKPRNSMDERKIISNQDKRKSSSLGNSQSARHSMCAEPLSDDGMLPEDSSTDAGDSDENSTKKWVKNPLMVKKKQKIDKRKSFQNGETVNVQNKENNLKPEVPSRKPVTRSPQMSNRDVYVYQDKSNGQKAKYQKLEERRNRRVDMAVTSDEELNSPQIRISRLRQRALQEAKISSRLPDYLDESVYKQTEQKSNRINQQQSMGQIPVENGSSSSEQITLKPIGPSQRDFSSYRQWEHDNNSVNSRTQNVTSSGYGNYGNKPVPPERPSRNVQGQIQGSYKKIPKQEVDYTGNIRSGNIDNKQSYFQSQQGGVARQQNVNYNQPKPSVSRSSSNLPIYGSKDGYSDHEISFQELKTKEPILLKKAIGRVEKKRKSHSDDDSLDELIESNIQYLESEIESGRLKKMTSSQPGMFPISGSDAKRTSDKEKRRSSSLDGVSRPAQSSFQNEVKLRLQIPSASRPNYRSNQYEGYDNRGDAMPQYSQPQQSVLRPHEILYQNTIPVERRFQSATHSPYLQRRSTAELANMEDMSKSDSQLNTSNYGLEFRQPMNYQNPQYPQSHVISRSPIVDMSSEHQTVIQNYAVCPGMESGMFSDVDYDIEVSERVKKWEKLMKKKTDDPGGDKKGGAVSLTTILESEGGVPDGWLPAKPVSPSVAVSSVTVTVTKSTTHMEPPPEPSSHRMFRVLQQPELSKPSESSVTYIRPPPYVDNSHQSTHTTDHHYSDYTNNDVMSAAKQSWPPSDQEMSAKDQQKLARLSKYEEELNEIQVLKMDSVKDLRKRFDSDASGNESTDTKEVVTPIRLTPLRKRRHLVKSFEPSPSPPVVEQYKKSTRPKVREVEPPELIDISAVSSGVEPQNEEVWSPKLESSKGLVSIERVTARTLQTIPFSEDPIWKQIEEMTTFDQLLANEALNLQSPSQQAHLHRNSYIDVPSPTYSQTTTVTTNTAIYTPPVSSEPIKTKPFATPKIQPLKLSIKTKSTATPPNAKSSATALDEVLEDVRLSLQRKPGGDSSSSLQSPLYVQPVQQSFPRTYTNSDNSDANFTPSHNIQTRLAKPETNNIYARQSMIDRELEPFMQSLIDQPVQSQPVQSQPVQSQPVQNQPIQINPDFTQYPYVINGNYQLDPHLLKEKLMDTGLANLDETLSTRSITPAYSPAITPLHPRFDHQQQLQQQFQYHQQLQQQPHNWQQQYQQQYQQNQQQPQHQFQQQQYQTQQYQQQPQQTYLHQQQQLLQQQQQQPKQQQNKSAAEQICKTMEDLKNLAKEVEMKLSQIKYKIVDADESKLDSIIMALKNFSPEPLEKMDTPKVESTAEQTERQRKLSGALAELERIYESLSVCDDSYSEKRPIGQSHSSSALDSQSVMSSHTIPRQHTMYTDTAHSQSRNSVYGNQPGMRRNKSDSDCTIKNLRGETLAEVERQTQREFDDINRSFQTLLAEVNQHSGSKPSVSKTKTSHTAEIEETIDSLLRDLQKAADNRSSSQPVSKSTSSSRLTESLIDDLVNKQLTTQNTCREIRKSEVFTTSSGPFSVLVGINGSGRKPRYPGKNKPADNEQVSKEVKPYTQSEQDDVFTTDNKGVNTGPSKPKTKSSRVQIKLKKELANRNEKKHFGSRQEDCDSEDSEEGQKIYRRARRQGNLQHRKSMPADILKKSVETQTFEDYTPVAEIREKFQSKGKSDSTGNEESSSSETFSGEAKGPRKRKISKGIAEKMEIFSSSDDERSKQFPLVHSHSAPDLTELFKGDKKWSYPSKTKKIRSPRFVKQRNERARKKSSQSSKDDSTEEKGEEFSVTSATSDDGQMSQGSKPPVHPGRKQRSSSPDKVFSDSSRSDNRAFFAVKKGSQVETRDFGKTERRPDACSSEVVLRKKVKKETRDDSPERPHSFHELLAAFETDQNHLNKLCYALRKCASADCVSGETMLKKCYHSEPDLRDDVLGSDVSKGQKDVKLQVEVKIKQ